MPHLNKLIKTHGDKLVIIGVHSQKGADPKKIADYIEAQKIAYAVCTDTSGKTAKAYGINSYPDYCVIDKQGILRFADLANSQLEATVAHLISE